MLRYGKKNDILMNQYLTKIAKLYHFDYIFYLDQYPDLRKNGIHTQTQAILHYLKHGRSEKRVCNKQSLIENYTYHLIQATKTKQLDTISLHKKESKINILIRTSNRPNFFKKCILSVLKQDYTNYHIYICCDNENSFRYVHEFTKTFNHITSFKTSIPKLNRCYYNVYCNQLISKVNDGWILFLDDDDLIFDKNAFKLINSKLIHKNMAIFWKFLRPDKLIYPNNLYDIHVGDIANSGYCIHSKYSKDGVWNNHEYSDFYYIDTILKKNKILHRYFIDDILTGTTYNNKILGQGLQENNLKRSLRVKDPIQCNQIESYLYTKDMYLVKKNIPIYFVNLDRCYNRLTSFRENISRTQSILNDKKIDMTLHIHRIRAIDAKNIYDLEKHIADYQYVNSVVNETPGEIACCSSQIRAIQTSYQNGDKYALIMEDDMNMILLGELYQEFISLVNSPHVSYEIFQLAWMELTWDFENRCDEIKKYIPPNNILIYKSIKPFLPWYKSYFCGGCYLITRNGMKKIVDMYIDKDNKINYSHYLKKYNISKHNILDNTTEQHHYLVADYLIYDTCNTITSPIPFSYIGDEDSTLRCQEDIDTSHQIYQSKIKDKVFSVKEKHILHDIFKNEVKQIYQNVIPNISTKYNIYLLFVSIDNDNDIEKCFNNMTDIDIVIYYTGNDNTVYKRLHQYSNIVIKSKNHIFDNFYKFFFSFLPQLQRYEYIGIFNQIVLSHEINSDKILELFKQCSIQKPWIGSPSYTECNTKNNTPITYVDHIPGIAPIFRLDCLNMMMNYYPYQQLSESTVYLWYMEILGNKNKNKYVIFNQICHLQEIDHLISEDDLEKWKEFSIQHGFNNNQFIDKYNYLNTTNIKKNKQIKKNIFMYIYDKYKKNQIGIQFDEYLESIHIEQIKDEYKRSDLNFDVDYTYYKLFPVHIIKQFPRHLIKEYNPPFRLLIHSKLSEIKMIHRFGWSDVIEYLLHHNYHELYGVSSFYFKYPYFGWYECAIDNNYNTYRECIMNENSSYKKYNNIKSFMMCHYVEWISCYGNLGNCPIPRINFAHDPYISENKKIEYNIPSYKIWYELDDWKNIKDSEMNSILITTSNHQKNDLITNNVVKKNKVETIYHPINLDNNNQFLFNSYLKKKHIYLIGWWLRDYTSFIKLAFNHKIILIKSKEGEWVSDYFLNQISEIMNEYRKTDSNIPLLNNNIQEKISTFTRNNNTYLKYNLTNSEYDKIFKESIIFLDIWNCSANNVVLECIRNSTPLLIRKHPACIEYLGKNYPFYFETISEANMKCNNIDLIKKTHIYLRNMNKSKFSYETYNKLFSDIIMSILKCSSKY